MAVNLSPVGGVAAQFFNNDGTVLSGGLIYTYAAGTNTPAASYTTGAGIAAHTNPIVLDSAGRVPTGEIWLTDNISYKFVIKDSSMALIGTYDNIAGINSNFVNYSSSQEIQTATAGQTVFTLTTMAYQPATNSLSVFVDGVNQYGPSAAYAFTETSSTSVTFTAGLHVGAQVKFTTAVINNAGGVDAGQVSYQPPAPGTAVTNVQQELRNWINIDEFGAHPITEVGYATFDSGPAIQAAVDFIKNNLTYSKVIIQGSYRVNATINATNVPGIIFEGQGGAIGYSNIMGYTGSTPIIDLCGTYGFGIRGIQFYLMTSTIGILTGWDAANNSGNFWSRYSDVAILTGAYDNSTITANSGLGYVGIMNYGGENISYHNLRIQTVMPIILTGVRNCSWIRGTTVSSYNITSAFVTLPAQWTMGAQIFSGFISLGAFTWNRPAIAVNSAIGLNMSGAYLQTQLTGTAVDGAYKVAFQAEAIYGANLHLYTEIATTAMEASRIEASQIQFASGNIVGTVIALYAGAVQKIQSTNFLVWLTTNDWVLDATATNPYTDLIKNCTIVANQEYANKVVSPYLVARMNNSRWSGANSQGNRFQFGSLAVIYPETGFVSAQNVLGTLFYTEENLVPVPASTTTTVFTFSAISSQVRVYMGSVSFINGNPAYGTVAFIVCQEDSTLTLTVLKTATNLTVTVSGLNIQANQTSLTSQGCAVSLTRIK